MSKPQESNGGRPVNARQVMNRFAVTTYRRLVPRTVRGKRTCLRSFFVIVCMVLTLNLVFWAGWTLRDVREISNAKVNHFIEDTSDDVGVTLPQIPEKTEGPSEPDLWSHIKEIYETKKKRREKLLLRRFFDKLKEGKTIKMVATSVTHLEREIGDARFSEKDIGSEFGVRRQAKDNEDVERSSRDEDSPEDRGEIIDDTAETNYIENTPSAFRLSNYNKMSSSELVRPQEVTNTLDGQQEESDVPDRPQETTNAPDRPQETTNAPDRPQEANDAPVRSQATTDSPDRSQEVTNRPDRTQEANDAPNRSPEVTNTPDKSHEVNDAPDRSHEVTNTPKRPQDASHSPNMHQANVVSREKLSMQKEIDSPTELEGDEDDDGDEDKTSKPQHSEVIKSVSSYATDAPDRPQEATDKPDRPQEVTYTPDRPQEVTNTPDRPQEETNRLDRPQEITDVPERPQEAKDEPDRPQEATHEPDRPEETTDVPDRPQEVTTTPDRPQEANDAPDRPQETNDAPERSHKVTNTPDKPQEVTDSPDRLQEEDDAPDRPQEATDESDRSQEATDEPDRSHEATDEPDRPQETTDVPGRSQEVTNAPDRQQEANDVSDRPQETTDVPDRSQEVTNTPDRPQEANDAPDRPEKTIDAPDRSQKTTDTPDRPHEATDEPDRSQEADDTPDRPQKEADVEEAEEAEDSDELDEANELPNRTQESTDTPDKPLESTHAPERPQRLTDSPDSSQEVTDEPNRLQKTINVPDRSQKTINAPEKPKEKNYSPNMQQANAVSREKLAAQSEIVRPTELEGDEDDDGFEDKTSKPQHSEAINSISSYAPPAPRKITIKTLAQLHKTELPHMHTEQQSNRRKSGKLKELPLIDMDDLETLKPRVRIVIFVMTAVSRSDRRKAIRETWWSRCKPPEAACYFVTDGYIDESMYDDVKAESDEHKDILFLPTDEGLNFGLRLLYTMEWSLAKYHYDFFLRLDDDYFICIEKLLHELQYQIKVKVAWGFWHCDTPYVVYLDESFALLSHDLIVTFLSWDDKTLLCHAYGDQQLALWLNQISDVNAFNDYRLHHHPPAHKYAHFQKMENICERYLGLHGAYPDDMRGYWQRAGDGPRSVSGWPKLYPQTCRYRKYFDWRKIKEQFRHTPKYCNDNPRWTWTRNRWDGRQDEKPVLTVTEKKE
ncbi:titin [Nematostella vectensis]|uniref:titin n=1 Tax=Nematostella vectensis TaxID=45351 RepID=UPI002076D724|nr:titin [Nematostella vectensis]